MDIQANPQSKGEKEENQVHMKKTKVTLTANDSGFAEDKDAAKTTRVNTILPVLEAGGTVVLDFKAVSYATQSYIHALIGEPLKKYQDQALARLEFKNCSPQLKSLISLVVDYSLGGFAAEGETMVPTKKRRRAA